jgi:hypothetical protein
VPADFNFNRKSFPGLPAGAIYMQGMVLCEKPKSRIEAERRMLKEATMRDLAEDGEYKRLGSGEDNLKLESEFKQEVKGAAFRPNRGFA